ncbi:MAG: sporulation protein YqfD [Clostridia bacterium]|nr:sporulation protein YqfD [Clostridia bacterium]
MSNFSYKIKGVSSAKTFNKIASSGARLCGCKKVGRELRFSTKKRDKNVVINAVNTDFSDFSAVEKKSFLESLFSLSRIGIFLVIILSFLSCVFLSKFVFITEVRGLDKVSLKKVLLHLDSVGASGVFLKDTVDCDELKNGLLKNFPFSAVSVETRGLTLLVSVKEELDAPYYDDIPIRAKVSSEDAIVSRVITLDGTALVGVGESVRRGEKLIDCVKSVGDVLIESRAVGEVYGRVWREAEVFIPQKTASFRDSGNSAVFYSLSFSKDYCASTSPFTSFREERYYTPFFSILPIYHCKTVYYEQKPIEVDNPEYINSSSVERKLKDQILLKLGEEEYEFLRCWSTGKEVDGGKILKVIVEIEKRIDVYS